MGSPHVVKRPLVSVCLPNLNTRPYLQERIDTITAQTCTDWELVVSDNYSDDGAWEFFEAVARGDRRVSIAQAPRQGLYANWNRCIERAAGEFVYIATSDDTMAPDCLERLAAALVAHPECDIAHCRLRTIDEHGRDLPDWWSTGSTFAESSGPLLEQHHVRLAPFDGLLHLLGGSVYISITQLLIRRSLFDRIGLFDATWGSLGDFNWNMRAGLVANTVHAPDTWGGWRLHQTQATARASIGSDRHAASVTAMIDAALAAAGDRLSAGVRARLPRWTHEAAALRAFEREVAKYEGRSRDAFVVWEALKGSAPARLHANASLRRRPFTHTVEGWLKTAGIAPVLLPVRVPAPSAPLTGIAATV